MHNLPVQLPSRVKASSALQCLSLMRMCNVFIRMNSTWSIKNYADIRHGRHCVFLMHVHLVFVTKYRCEVFTKEILNELHVIFAQTCLDFEAELVEFEGED